MNPASQETTGINLPPPAAEQVAATQQYAEAGLPLPEMSAARAEVSSQQPAVPMPGSAAAQAPQAAAHGVMPIPTGVSSTTQSVVPAVLDDKDLIEKEWVNKAKAIVEKNRDDPYKQSEELTAVRAEYLQKNYNKTIKSGT